MDGQARNKKPTYRGVFMAGWELANWRFGQLCPDSNILLADFFAGLNLNWPTNKKNAADQILKTKAVLQDLDPQLALWIEIGLVSNSIVHETTNLQTRLKGSIVSGAPKPLLSLQNRFAKLLVEVNATPNEREDLIYAVRGLMNSDQDEAVPALIDSIGGVIKRIELGMGVSTTDSAADVDMDDIKGKVDFVILTIREDENRAVLKRFPKEEIYEGDHRSYSICTVQLQSGEHYLVAVVRSIEQGEGHSQDVARDAIEDLDPQWILLVGIGGAVPADEFTLGDVVAASRLTDFSVKAALEGDRNQYAVGGGPMHKAVQNELALIPAMSDELGEWNTRESIGMERPAVNLDDKNFYGDVEWREKVKGSIYSHFGPHVTARQPLVTVGPVVSSDTLVKDSQTLKQWQESSRHVLAVEMELSGVYIAAHRIHHEYPVLAIRGISDIVGFKRSAVWTGYACQTAAAFAHSFVLTEPIHPRSLMVEVATTHSVSTLLSTSASSSSAIERPEFLDPELELLHFYFSDVKKAENGRFVRTHDSTRCTAASLDFDLKPDQASVPNVDVRAQIVIIGDQERTPVIVGVWRDRDSPEVPFRPGEVRTLFIASHSLDEGFMTYEHTGRTTSPLEKRLVDKVVLVQVRLIGRFMNTARAHTVWYFKLAEDQHRKPVIDRISEEEFLKAAHPKLNQKNNIG